MSTSTESLDVPLRFERTRKLLRSPEAAFGAPRALDRSIRSVAAGYRASPAAAFSGTLVGH
jgi:hypothetical protein